MLITCTRETKYWKITMGLKPIVMAKVDFTGI